MSDEYTMLMQWVLAFLIYFLLPEIFKKKIIKCNYLIQLLKFIYLTSSGKLNDKQET